MGCPDDDTLIALIEDALPPTRLIEIEAHVDQCAACRQVIASIAAVGTTSRGVRTQPRAPCEELGDPEIAPAAVLGGRYWIAKLIGRGGMGMVYLARDVRLGRDVAVKVDRVRSGRGRLHREAVAMARLAHPNVVTVFEIGEIDARRFVAMEYVRGGTSRDWLAKPRAWRDIVGLFLAAGEGLAAAHRAGLVHRDFKPENVLVGDDGRARVTDFGLVGAREERAGSPTADVPVLAALTETGAIVGTPAYMAPEQTTGGPIDGRCDQFSFCVTVWEALFGERPFAGATSAAIQAAIARRELRPVSRTDVPARVRRVLERGLAASAGDRYPDMPALLVALRRAARSRTRRWLAIAAVAMLAVGGIAVATTATVQRHRRQAACAAEVDRIRELLGPDARAAISAAFASTHLSFAANAFEHTRGVLERYRDALASQTQTTCAADKPAELAAPRARCLRDHAAVLARLIAELEHADRQIVESAPRAAWSLVERVPCEDLHESLDVALPAASSPDADRLVDARTRLATGTYAEGIREVTPVVAAARARADHDTELAALDVSASLYFEAGPDATAEATLHDELALAEALGRDHTAARSLARLATLAADPDRNFAEAHRDLELAYAKLARLGGGDRALEAALFVNEGQVLTAELRFADAEAAFRRGIALLEQTYGSDHPVLAKALVNLNGVLRGEGRNDEALAAITRALAMFQRTLGDDHPDVASAWGTLADTLIKLQRYPEARADLQRADTIYIHTMGEDHPMRGAIYGELGTIALAQHDVPAALSAFRHELAIIERRSGPTSGPAGWIHGEIAIALFDDGRYADALAEDRHSLAILESAASKDDPIVAAPLEGIARCLVALARPAEAIAPAERALALTTAHPGFDPAQVASLEELLATARLAARTGR